MKNKYLIDAIDCFISGDWGQEQPCEQTPNKVFCVRGADIENVNAQKTDDIPKRYVKDTSLRNKRLNVGDIVIEKSGGSPTQSTGRVAYISQKVKDNLKNIVCSNFCTAFKSKKDYDSKYLFYYLQNVYNSNVFFQFESQTTGIKNLLLDFALKEIPIHDIDLPIQRRIASVLSCLDEKIALNNRINDNLEAMAKTLYDYWFVQNADERWKAGKIKDIAETGSGGTPLSKNKEYYENGNIAWINSGELNNGYIVETKNFITEKGLNNSNAKLYPINTILIAMYGATAGKVSLLKIPATTNQAICAIIPYLNTYTYYLKYRLSDLYHYLVLVSSGSARDNLSQDLIKNIEIELPNNSLLEHFNNTANPIIEKIVKNQQQNLKLARLRDWLLPMLMNGQVSVNYHLSLLLVLFIIGETRCFGNKYFKSCMQIVCP
jgi:type I restriction enzyme S subunit